jgi:hypothetical protein
VPDQLVSGAVANTIAHSTMGDLVVGNYDIAGKPGSGNGFIYDIRTGAYTLLTIGEFATAYGIWQNGGSTSSSYTIAGGYKGGKGLNVGFLVNYDSSTGQFTGLSDFSYDNNPGIVTHFEGITGVPGGYALAATGDNGAAFAAIASNGNGKFGVPKWVAIKYDASVGLCTGNSILDNNLIGIYQPAAGGVQSYLATVSDLAVSRLLMADAAPQRTHMVRRSLRRTLCPEGLRRARNRLAAAGADLHHRQAALIGAVGAKAKQPVDAGKTGRVGQDLGRVPLPALGFRKCCDQRNGVIGEGRGSDRFSPEPRAVAPREGAKARWIRRGINAACKRRARKHPRIVPQARPEQLDVA